MSEHLCHATGCNVPVPPKLLMCGRHWRMVPYDVQRRVWKNYRKGQEIDKRPSQAYLQVMQEAIAAVAEMEKTARTMSSTVTGSMQQNLRFRSRSPG